MNLRSSKRTHVTNSSRPKGHKPPTTVDKGLKGTKRKIDPSVEYDVQHTMVTRSRDSRDDLSESPNAKRPRRAQTRRQGPVMYSERWHPMDDVLSPKKAAKVKAMYRNPLDSSDTNDSGEEQMSDTDDTKEESSDDQESSAHDTEEERGQDQELSPASDPAPSPGCRRSSRKLSNRNIPNYDRRYVTLPLLSVGSGHHSIVDEMGLDFIRPLIRLYVQLLPGLR